MLYEILWPFAFVHFHLHNLSIRVYFRPLLQSGIQCNFIIGHTLCLFLLLLPPASTGHSFLVHDYSVSNVASTFLAYYLVSKIVIPAGTIPVAFAAHIRWTLCGIQFNFIIGHTHCLFLPLLPPASTGHCCLVHNLSVSNVCWRFRGRFSWSFGGRFHGRLGWT